MEQMFIPSDERIKECICPLKDLLHKLDQINFVSYDRIDKYSIGCDAGVIAQDIVKIYPNMVSLKSGFIPNIQQTVEHNLMEDDIVSIRITNSLKEKDVILCLINVEIEKQPYSTTIMNATDDSIQIKKWEDYSPTDILFIHGTMVDDYHIVDIGQIGVLGAACAKELYQVVKCQAETISALNGTCATLNGTCTALQAANAATSSQLATLQQQLDTVLARLN